MRTKNFGYLGSGLELELTELHSRVRDLLIANGFIHIPGLDNSFLEKRKINMASQSAIQADLIYSNGKIKCIYMARSDASKDIEEFKAQKCYHFFPQAYQEEIWLLSNEATANIAKIKNKYILVLNSCVNVEFSRIVQLSESINNGCIRKALYAGNQTNLDFISLFLDSLFEKDIQEELGLVQNIIK
jgi:hypothetical protein